MQKAAFVAHCDVELDDIVKHEEEKYIIHDIVAVHSVRFNEVKFNFVLANEDGMVVSERDGFKLIAHGGES